MAEQIERCAAYLRHVVDAHGGRWSVSEVNGSDLREAKYDGPGPSADREHVMVTAPSETDAVIFLAHGLHAQLSPCDDCPSLAALVG